MNDKLDRVTKLPPVQINLNKAFIVPKPTSVSMCAPKNSKITLINIPNTHKSNTLLAKQSTC